MKKIYVWYSSATDVTGKNIIEELQTRLDSTLFTVTGGKVEPPSGIHYVIGYGTKTSEDVNFNLAKVLNNPNNIRVNRNKLKALDAMKAAEILVAKFSKVNNRSYAYLDAFTSPVILRTNYHQGGRGLSVCLNGKQAKTLLKESENNFGYVQELISFKTEYRIHVFNGSIIRCAKKVTQRNPNASWKANYTEKIKASAEKNNVELHEATLDTCLKIIGIDNTLPDLIVKSNKHGWKFKTINLVDTPSGIKDIAKQSVHALGLNFGAVDCAVDYSEKAYVIEVNSGPGLQRGTLECYIVAFAEYFGNEVAQEETEVQRRATPARRSTRRSTANVAQSMQEEINSLIRASRENNDKLMDLLSRVNN